MTNPCFQNTKFTTLMKGKHVTNAWEETLLESVGEVSDSEKENVNDEENDEFNAGGDNGSVNDEVTPSDPIANNSIANLLSQATQEPGQRISARLQGIAETRYIDVPHVYEGILGAAVEENQNPTTGKCTRKRRPTPDNENIRRGKCPRTITARFAPSSRATVRIRPRKRACAPDTDYSPPVVNSSILFPIRVTREKWNCAFGNTKYSEPSHIHQSLQYWTQTKDVEFKSSKI
jgi:hypothetical protein